MKPTRKTKTAGTGIRARILADRRENESRAAHSRRIGVAESTLRWCEKHDRSPRGLAGQSFARALGLTEKAVGK